MKEPCEHSICREVGDGTCHINADGWVINSTPKVMAVVERLAGWPQDDLAKKIRAAIEPGELIRFSRSIADDPKTPEKERKQALAWLDRMRKSGMPID